MGLLKNLLEVIGQWTVKDVLCAAVQLITANFILDNHLVNPNVYADPH